MKSGTVFARLFFCLALVAGGTVTAAFALSKEDKAEIAELKQKAERGDVDTQFELGIGYLRGRWDDQKDKTEAEKWFRLAIEQYRSAAEQGNAEAQKKLGDMYYHGYGVEQDYTQAFKWNRLAAEQGNEGAQFDLGWLYLYGKGVETNKTEAAKLFRHINKSFIARAEQGEFDGSFRNLAGRYYYGTAKNHNYGDRIWPTLVQDTTRALKWYRLAIAEQGDLAAKNSLAQLEKKIKETEGFRRKAEQGDVNAQYELGLAYFHGKGVNWDEAKAEKWLRTAAEQGHTEAEYRLGLIYLRDKGINRDGEEAEKWFRAAAEQGHTNAGYRLGSMYEKGEGVEKNDAEAAKWFRAAAEQGHTNAGYRLGSMYEKGEGVEKNDAEAAKWFRAAADAKYGHDQAGYRLGLMYEEGRGVEQNEVEAFKLFRRAGWYYAGKKLFEIFHPAAERGEAYPQYEIGVAYLNGKGVKKDVAEGLKWLRLAAEQGYVKAQYQLGGIYYNGSGDVEEDKATAVEWYRLAANQGYAEAQNRLGFLLLWGDIERDSREAVKWLRRADKQGQSSDQLGWRYFHGDAGVTQDYYEAYVRLFARGSSDSDKAKKAKANLTAAQIKSAEEEAWKREERRQERAEKKRKAEEEAALAWRKANVVPDLRRKGDAYYKGKGVLPNYKEAAKWYRQAAERGDAEAQYRLGLMYAEGKRGIEQNHVEAYIWLALAGVNDTGEIGDKAASLREKVEENLTAEQFEQAQAEATKHLENF